MRLPVGLANDVERFLAHRLAMQEGIDFHISHAVGRFVRLARNQVFQIGRRHFLHQ
ncbi:hypothetical protein D9M72_629880 [compost metagenome]